jgi:hypothetical protein
MATGDVGMGLAWLTDRATPSQVHNTQDSNSYKKYKRNILWGILHFVSGLPTDEMMAKQVKLDGEIRDRVTTTLGQTGWGNQGPGYHYTSSWPRNTTQQ